VRNFGTTNPENGVPRPVDGLGDTLNTVPIWLTDCPPTDRDVSDEELANINGGVPKDQGLWLPDREGLMAPCETLACSRTGGKPPKWSVKLVPEEFDYVPGWALRVPYKLGGATSMRECARGLRGDTGKGFAVSIGNHAPSNRPGTI
jgi:hypothetical protein